MNFKLISGIGVFLHLLVQHNDARDYVYVTTTMTWPNALAYCQNTYGTSLATITTAEEHDDVIAEMNARGIAWAWIGLNDLSTSGVWQWADGTDCSYTSTGLCKDDDYWNSGEPTGGSEHCTYVSRGSGGYNDNPCTVTPSVICNAPEPTTTEDVRDCTVLAIDEFLLQCSDEWSSQSDTISDLSDRITALETGLTSAESSISTNAASITQLQTDLTDVTAEVSDLQTASTDLNDLIISLQTQIDDTNARIDLFAAHAPGTNLDAASVGDAATSSSMPLGLTMKDLIIILLLLMNMIGMMWIHCYYVSNGKGRATRTRKSAKYSGIELEETEENQSDVEPMKI